MLNFELVRNYIESQFKITIPKKAEVKDFYGDFYDRTSAYFCSEEDVEAVVKDLKSVWLDNTKLAVELFSGDCRNIAFIKDFTGCSIKAIDIQDRNAAIEEAEFILGDCTKELEVAEVDAMFAFNNGVAILNTIDELDNHFRVVSKSLKKDGVYYTEYQLPLDPFEVFRSEFSDAVLYKMIEKTAFEKYRMHEILVYKDNFSSCEYSVSSIQSHYNIRVYESIAEEHGLRMIKNSTKFNGSFMLFTKL